MLSGGFIVIIVFGMLLPTVTIAAQRSLSHFRLFDKEIKEEYSKCPGVNIRV